MTRRARLAARGLERGLRILVLLLAAMLLVGLLRTFGNVLFFI